MLVDSNLKRQERNVVQIHDIDTPMTRTQSPIAQWVMDSDVGSIQLSDTECDTVVPPPSTRRPSPSSPPPSPASPPEKDYSRWFRREPYQNTQDPSTVSFYECYPLWKCQLDDLPILKVTADKCYDFFNPTHGHYDDDWLSWNVSLGNLPTEFSVGPFSYNSKWCIILENQTRQSSSSDTKILTAYGLVHVIGKFEDTSNPIKKQRLHMDMRLEFPQNMNGSSTTCDTNTCNV